MRKMVSEWACAYLSELARTLVKKWISGYVTEWVGKCVS